MSDPDRMFEHRLGLALGMTLTQLRAMPYEEYKSWQSYYKIEPWGFQDREYRTAALMMMLWNTHIQKRQYAKKINDFIRDPERAIDEQVNRSEMREKLLKLSKEDRVEMIAAAFGGMGIKTKVANDNSGDNSG